MKVNDSGEFYKKTQKNDPRGMWQCSNRSHVVKSKVLYQVWSYELLKDIIRHESQLKLTSVKSTVLVTLHLTPYKF
jgi:hypothetical protein